MKSQSVTLNRNLRAAWLVDALKLRANDVDSVEAVKQIDGQIALDIRGAESRRKSLRYLRQLWLEPHPKLEKLQQEAFELYRSDPREETARALSYFMLLAVYPFAREVAEACGQLFRLQGTIKTEQVKRKIASQLGDREPVLRSTRYVIAIFLDLGLLKTTNEKGVYVGSTKRTVSVQTALFALKAIFASYSDRINIARNEIETHPALFAFDANEILGKALASFEFTMSRESLSRQIVAPL